MRKVWFITGAGRGIGAEIAHAAPSAPAWPSSAASNRTAHMSASSLLEHFQLLTSMSPLQFQKTLRLQEARRLMLSTGMDAGLACQRVGYASPSQFSREYARHFGSAPTRDMQRLRSAGLADAVSFTQ